MRRQLLSEILVAEHEQGILQMSAYIRGAHRTVPEMRLGMLGISERPLMADVPFSNDSTQNRPLVDLTVELNQDLQSEAKLHPKSRIPCEAFLKISGTLQVSSAVPPP